MQTVGAAAELEAGKFQYYGRWSCEGALRLSYCVWIGLWNVVIFFWYANSGSTVIRCWLEDLNTTVDSLAKGTLVVILLCCLEEKDGLGKVGDFDVWRKVTRLGK